MKKILKTAITAAVVLTLGFTEVCAAPLNMILTYDGKKHNYSAESIELRVNGIPIELPLMPPVILEGRTYVPSREVFEPLGAVVDWKAASKEVYIGYNGSLVVMKPDAKTADVNGIHVPLESPAKIINDKLMIPARFVAEQLGIPVNWDPNGRIVSIGNAAEAEPTSQPALVSPPEQPAPEVAPAPAQSSALSVDASASPLTEISGSPVNITGVKAEGDVFTISASGQISKVDKLILAENKLVLDIYNATNALSSNSYASPGFSGVSAVRNSQFQTSPSKITRVVFDLVGANRFTVAFSSDRKSIIVSFEVNSLTNVTHSTAGSNEIITLTAMRPITISASRMFSPDRLVFDSPSTKYAAGVSELPVGGRFIQKIRASQHESGISRVVVDLSSEAQYNISYEGNTAVITLSEPTYKNIGYTQQPQPAITLSGAESLSASSIAHRDEYLSNRYTLTLPSDYSGSFGYGTFEINDSTLNSITIQNYNGKTELVFNQKKITTYLVESNGRGLVIRPVSPREAYRTVVYLDAGHGGNDPGATSGGYEEKNLNLDIIMRLNQLLEADGEIKTYLSRNDDARPQTAERAYAANPAADLFLSVHHNASESSRGNGTEVLYLNHEGEIYPNISSEAVARILQTNLSRDIDTTDRGVVKRPELIVLNQTKIPAVIVEVVFITNSDDLAKVSTPEGRQRVAESLYRSVNEIFRQYPTGR